MNNTVNDIPCPTTPTGDVILRTVGLSKNFGHLQAVKDLSLELRRGEVLGFLGPNGAGKSTTVGMILGLIAPSSGSMELFGNKVDGNRWAALRRIGAIIEEPAFYPYLSGRDNLEALSRAAGGIRKGKIDEVLKRVNLFDRAGDRYSHYSMGMKQRLGIASTLLKDPELIILDEPTNGLDPAGTKEVRDLIPQLAQENSAVFLCSHLLHEVELVCDRVAIIKQGHLIECAPVKQLVAAGQLFQILVADPKHAADVLKVVPGVISVTQEGAYLLVDAPKDSGGLLNKALTEKKIYASEISRRASSLEEVFLQLTGGENNAKAH